MPILCQYFQIPKWRPEKQDFIEPKVKCEYYSILLYFSMLRTTYQMLTHVKTWLILHGELSFISMFDATYCCFKKKLQYSFFFYLYNIASHFHFFSIIFFFLWETQSWVNLLSSPAVYHQLVLQVSFALQQFASHSAQQSLIPIMDNK